MPVPTPSVYATVVAAITAFIAVAPCPLFTSLQLTVVFVALTLFAWSICDPILAIAVAMGYIATVLRCREQQKGSTSDHFTARAPLYMDVGEGAGDSVQPMSTDMGQHAAVDEGVGVKELQALITPELLHAAQSNEVPT